MSNSPDLPHTDMAGNGERVPDGPEAIPAADEQADAAEHRTVGRDMDMDTELDGPGDDRSPDPAP